MKNTLLFSAGLWFLSAVIIYSSNKAIAQPQNPSLIKDLLPGPDFGRPYGMMKVANNKFLLFSFDVNAQYNLWVSNGTTAGTIIVKQFDGGSFPRPSSIIPLPNQTAVFIAPDPLHGTELWVTNGSPNGTSFVKDINPGTNSSYIQFGPVWNGKVFFIARATTSEVWNLWITDGTAAGTKQLATSVNFGNQFPQYNFVSMIYNGALYFYGYNSTTDVIELWRSNGTVGGTLVIQTLNKFVPQNGYLAVYNNLLFFHGYDSQHGEEVWKSNGTFAGTQLLKDINTGPAGSSPVTLTVYNGRLYFVALKSNSGHELWSSNGTKIGTQLLKDANPGTADGAAYIMGAAAPYLYFAGIDNIHGTEPWRTDGTPAGTIFLKDCLDFETQNSQPGQITPAGSNVAYFTAMTEKGEFDAYGLFRTDGSPNGTTFVFDPGSADVGLIPVNQLTYASGELFCRSQNTDGYFELTKTDGINTELYDFAPNDDDATNFMVVDGNIIYLCFNRDINIGAELYKLDTSQPIQKGGQGWGDYPSSFTLYPNPASQILNVHFTNNKSGSPGRISVMDLAGRICYEADYFILEGEQDHAIELNPAISNGYYIFRIESENLSLQQPFVLQR